MNSTSTINKIKYAMTALIALSIMGWSGTTAASAQGATGGNPTFGPTGQAPVDSNPVTASDIRKNYFSRYPFAKDANSHDVLQKVDDGNNTPVSPSGQPTPVSRMQKSAAGVPNMVMAYIPLYNQMPYFQLPSPALDTPATMRDSELFDNQLTTFGVPMSDSQFQIIDRENKQRFLELMFDPERMMWTVSNLGLGSSSANSLAGTSESAFDTAVNRISSNGSSSAGSGGSGGGGGGSINTLSGIGSILSNTTLGPSNGGLGIMPNIANEASGSFTASNNPNKSISQAIWMVQQMYKFVFVPMSILFLLPGAVATQVKGQVAYAFSINQDDNSSPFEGILRAMIAIFLIPATQLIVSYSIDVGNAMCYSVSDYVDAQVVQDWAHKLTYNTPISKVDNAIMPPAPANSAAQSTESGYLSNLMGGSGMGGALGFVESIPGVGSIVKGLLSALGLNFGAGGEGLGAQQQETSTINERQLWLSSVLELVFNMVSYLFSLAVIVLGAFQLVMLCYLFLLGPLAAAMFAWPKIGQNINRDMFGGWCNAVIMCSLWRFYWMVILAIMTQRILYIMDNNLPLDLQWEVVVFVCFLGLMLYVPFNPWSFDPGQAFDTAMQSGTQLAQSAGGAMGQAAQAAGVPASTISQMGNQFNQAMAPSGQFTQNMTASDYALVNPVRPSAGGLDNAAGSHSGEGSAPPPAGQNNPSSAPPNSPPTLGGMSPAMAPPPQAAATNPSPNEHTASNAPPNESQSSNPSLGAVADAAPPNTHVASMTESTNPLTPQNSGVTMAANPNTDASHAAPAVESLQPQLAAAGVSSGEASGQGAAPPLEQSSASGSGSAASSPPPIQLADSSSSSSATSAAPQAPEASPNLPPVNPSNDTREA